jgi:hypothetical protein
MVGCYIVSFIPVTNIILLPSAEADGNLSDLFRDQLPLAEANGN